MNEALAGVEALGNESRDQFRKRVEQSKKAQAEQNLVWTDFKVKRRTMETPSVVALELERWTGDREMQRETSSRRLDRHLTRACWKGGPACERRAGGLDAMTPRRA